MGNSGSLSQGGGARWYLLYRLQLTFVEGTNLPMENTNMTIRWLSPSGSTSKAMSLTVAGMN